MASKRLLVLLAVAILSLLFTWGLATNRWRRGRPAIIALAIVAALLMLTRRVSVVELLVVMTLPVLLLVLSGGGRRAPRGRRR